MLYKVNFHLLATYMQLFCGYSKAPGAAILQCLVFVPTRPDTHGPQTCNLKLDTSIKPTLFLIHLGLSEPSATYEMKKHLTWFGRLPA